jgi:hypothetical protein
MQIVGQQTQQRCLLGVNKEMIARKHAQNESVIRVNAPGV